MYIKFSQHKNATEIYQILGKALMICHRFEDAVKFVMNVLLSSHGFNANKLTLEDIFDTTTSAHKKIFNQSLGQKIQHPWLLETTYFDNNKLKILSDGKDARNYLCHESTLGFSYGFDTTANYKFLTDLNLIKDQIAKLCRAYALISEYHYQIQEKEPSHFDSNVYCENLENWIYGQIKS
jgi:hypothetical protein